MAYIVFFDGVELPVTPEKMDIKIKNQNKTVNLINDGEINILKSGGLTEIDFDVRIPQTRYPFAQYPDGFHGAPYYLDIFERLKTDEKPFRFIFSRCSPKGELLFDTNMNVSLEDYTITEDAKNGFDIIVAVKLKQYRLYGTKKLEIQPDKKSIQTSSARTVQKNNDKTCTVVKGDSLYNLAKKYLGDGSKYPELYAANKALIDSGNKGTGNPRYTIYPHQVFAIPK